MTTTTTSTVAAVRATDRLEAVGFACVIGFAASLQFSIAAANIFLGGVLACWLLVLIARRETIEVPRMYAPLVAYAALTLVSAAFSRDPRDSFVDSKQLVLFLLVPAVYRFARGPRAATILGVVITVGAASAAVGIVQYGILKYDNLGQRPQGTLGHYMTYSGLLMLVIAAATSRLLFETRERAWPALVMPALLVAVVLTFTRSAWVGACAGAALLFALKDFRLTAILPVIAAVAFIVAPANLTDRFYSMFNLKDPTYRERVVMLKAGAAMVRDRPLTGVGPAMIQREYPAYRDPSAVEREQPHLHNVPLQIAAERGLPALAVWIWFLAVVTVDMVRKLGASRRRFLPAAALASVAAMLGAGAFEYNFGDSEFLMLFLTLVTLPYAADYQGGLP